jgi:hypothetical protein
VSHNNLKTNTHQYAKDFDIYFLTSVFQQYVSDTEACMLFKIREKINNPEFLKQLELLIIKARKNYFQS